MFKKKLGLMANISSMGLPSPPNCGTALALALARRHTGGHRSSVQP